jgi:hypothetical protein
MLGRLTDRGRFVFIVIPSVSVLAFVLTLAVIAVIGPR